MLLKHVYELHSERSSGLGPLEKLGWGAKQCSYVCACWLSTRYSTQGLWDGLGTFWVRCCFPHCTGSLVKPLRKQGIEIQFPRHTLALQSVYQHLHSSCVPGRQILLLLSQQTFHSAYKLFSQAKLCLALAWWSQHTTDRKWLKCGILSKEYQVATMLWPKYRKPKYWESKCHWVNIYWLFLNPHLSTLTTYINCQGTQKWNLV